MSNRVLPPVVPAALATALLLAACGGSAGLSPTASPGTPAPPTSGEASPSSGPPSLAPDQIQHPTGPTDVVLRVGLEGGFVMMESLMGRVPLFTLYGDGRVLLVPVEADLDPIAAPVLREVRLPEAEVQELLAFALGDGGLAAAREDYAGMTIDAPSTVFEINTGEVAKRVVVNGLSEDPAQGPDAAAYRTFANLLSTLRAIPTAADHEAAGDVAVLAQTELGPGAPAAAPWPWADLAPADFVQPADGSAVPFPTHVLTPEQRAAAGAGTGPLNLEGPDGKTYVVVIRPGLPEETAGG